MESQPYVINAFPAAAPTDLLGLLQEVETATIGHHLHDRIVDPGLKPILPGHRIAGAAVTVSIPGPDSTLLYYVMDRIRPGDVLVVDRGGDTRHACWGGFMAAVAAHRKLAGVVIDGMITDPDEIRKCGIPTWARGVSAITTKLLNHGGSLNTAVSIGGVVIHPGDVVLADDCGIIALPASEMSRFAQTAVSDQAEEKSDLERLYAGESLQALVRYEEKMFSASV